MFVIRVFLYVDGYLSGLVKTVISVKLRVLRGEKMPKYYCDYCDTFLTHDSPSVRKTHNGGRKHKENVRMYYQGWMEQQAQKLVDATARAFKAGTLQPSMPRMMSQPGLRPGMYPTMPYAMHPAMMMQRPPLPTGAFPRPPMPMQ